MKKLITIDAIMSAFIGAIGYGVGYMIPEILGFHDIICYISCFAVGEAWDQVIDKIIYTKEVQSSPERKYKTFAGLIAFFIVAFIIVKITLGQSLMGEVGEGIAEVVLVPIVGFFISYITRHIKKYKLSKKYGTGESGFVFDKKVIDHLKTMTGENKIHGEYEGKDPVAKAVSGNYIGKNGKDVVSFLGITYAKAERWKKAIPVEDSTKFFEAWYFGNSEIQPDSSHNILTELNKDENCLNLNIWTSKLEENASKPVFVYFHGGDGRYGGSANPLYHLENIAKAISDAVFVSINYRFGVFGVIDFATSDLSDKDEYADSTALSLLDQVEALKWIKKNISAFGGNPDNITVAGDSAGGSDILLLAANSEAKGLFKRAYIMCASTTDTPDNNDKASLLGKKLIEEFDAKSTADLKALTSKQLEDFTAKYYDMIELSPRNGRFIPMDVEKEYLNGVASDIEFIFGIAADDISGWEAMLAGDVSLDAIIENYFEFFKGRVEKDNYDRLETLLNNYKKSGLSDSNSKKALLSDFQYKACPLHDCNTLVKGGSVVRVFYWDVNGDIEKLTANGVSMVTSILENEDIAEQMGYLHEKNIMEIMQNLMEKYINGDSPELFNNEIDGVSAISWDKYDADRGCVLHIQNSAIKMAEHLFSDSIGELESLVFD